VAFLRACRGHLREPGRTVAVLVPPSRGGYRDHTGAVLAASRRASLGYLRHLIVVTADVPGPGPGHEAPEPAREQVPRPEPARPGAAPISAPVHLDLLVFVLQPGRGHSRQPRAGGRP
jgi:hypothetical protein